MKLSRLNTWLLAATAASSFTPLAAHADDWGCKVLLCLSDPRGPTTESECRPPIEKLYRELAKGHAFPTCDMAGSPDTGGSYAQRVYDPYDPCPAGLGVAAAGSYVVQGRPTSNPANRWGKPYDLTGTPAVSQPGGGFAWIDSGPRACVGNPVGSYHEGGYGVGDGDPGYTVYVFDTVVWQQTQNPRAIDVYRCLN
jgi:hypothetical protein